MTEQQRCIELDENSLPSMLEICFKALGGRTAEERTVTVTAKEDGRRYNFVIEADLDYTGWADNGTPLNKKGAIKLKDLPEHALYQGTIDGEVAELALYPEEDGDPAENFLVINPED